jgi:predicted nucleic acid-binding protein
MTRTYLDSGVLIAAARGVDKRSRAAMEVLDDPDREFASSVFVELEILPKALYQKQADEAEFYRTYLAAVQYAPDNVAAVLTEALAVAETFGLNALDAIHVAAANATGAEELITTEQSSKPIFRVRSLRVVELSSFTVEEGA